MSEPRTIPVKPEKPGGAQNVGVAVATVPSRMVGGTAIRVDANGYDYSVNLDISELQVGPDGDPSQQWVPVWYDGQSGVEVWRVPIDAIPADAPADGFVYGRQNNAWVDVTSAVIIDWADIVGKPSTFPPDPHTHAINEINGLPEELAAIDSEIDTLQSNDTAM